MVTSGYWWPPENPIPYFSIKINDSSYFSRFDEGEFNDTLPDAYIEATAVADINMDNRADIVHCSGYGTYITFNTDSITDVVEQNNPVTYFDISNNYPNPFNSETRINYFLPQASKVKIIVYDILGNELKVLVDDFRSSGNHSINFSANFLSSGIYFYSLITETKVLTKSMVLLK